MTTRPKPIHPQLDSTFRSLSDGLMDSIERARSRAGLAIDDPEFVRAVEAWFGIDGMEAFENWYAEGDS